MTIPVGAHVPSSRPLQEAQARKADLAQFFLSNPQSWKKPQPRADADELRGSPIPLYVHSPYLINVASPNNRIRIPSRKILSDCCEAAESIGAAAVIVHGGHVGDEENVSEGYSRWRKALQQLETGVVVYIENTAGGGNAVCRELAGLAPLWEQIGDLGAGFCLDTCHAWSAGEDLATVVDRVRQATGRIDLVHCNDSRDPVGSGRDRHESPGRGEIPEALLVGVVREAGVPAVIESRGDAKDHTRDIAWLRDRLHS